MSLPTEGAPAAERPAPDRTALVEDLLDAALTALRQGALPALLADHPRAARWLLRRHLPLVDGSTGGVLQGENHLLEASALLLQWLVTQLRPDRAPRLAVDDAQAWLALTAWRPMLAVACHAGLLAVPDFPARYRRRAHEAPVDNLCGLWDVGPSTFYRYLERGKRAMALIVLERPLPSARSLGLRSYLVDSLTPRLGLADAAARTAWHRSVASKPAPAGDVAAPLWHAVQADDADAAVWCLTADSAALASAPETDALVLRLQARALRAAARFDLMMALAVLERTRNSPEREWQACEAALRIAADAEDPVLLGRACFAMGRYQEPRDADRAFALYDDSARHLLAADPEHRDPETLVHFATTRVRQGWMHVLRNHPQAKQVLDEAAQLQREHQLPDPLQGMLEQVWGEYWRIAGDLPRAIEAKHRALNIYLRIGDRRSTLVTYQNLISLYGLDRNLDLARHYANLIFEAARTSMVDPDQVAGANGNLAAAFVWAGRYDLAIERYLEALKVWRSADLRRQANQTLQNLANAYYHRFVETRDPTYESLGDEQLEAFFRAPASEVTPSWVEEAKKLKAEVLGEVPERPIDELLSQEAATHLEEMAEVQHQRRVLAAQREPAAAVQAHLAIAKAYLAISAKEREAARALVGQHGLEARFAGDFDDLQQTFQRELSREQQLAGPWKQAAADLLDDARRAALIAHLLRETAVNKSGYAELCGVAPATASKHLALLTERGLLQQTGKGPSTRYLLA